MPSGEAVIGQHISPEACSTEDTSGPFTEAQLLYLCTTMRAAEKTTELRFSVYVGPLDASEDNNSEDTDLPNTTVAARALHKELPHAAESVLIAVSPNQRSIEIVTGPVAAKKIPDRTCGLAALTAVSSFTTGDLCGGIVNAMTQLK